MNMRKPVLCALLSLLLFGFEPVWGQIWVGPTDVNPVDGSIMVPPRWATLSDFEGPLVFCRGYYNQNREEKGVWGWYTDYPGADYNFLVRFSELTKARIRRDVNRDPVYVVVRLDSPLLFHCPVLFLSDPGTIGLTESEVANLRLYFEKGGFLWADDFWGSQSWNHWEQQIRRVLPSESYSMIDIPATHPIMNQLFSIPRVPQIPNIGFWYRNKGQTSERGEDSKDVHFRGIEDKRGRLMAVMTHNTDIGDAWEREGFDTTKEYFFKFSPIGYELGINIFLYALTH